MNSAASEKVISLFSFLEHPNLTFGVLEPELMLTTRAKLWVVFRCVDEALQICQVHCPWIARWPPHPSSRFDMMCDESSPDGSSTRSVIKALSLRSATLLLQISTTDRCLQTHGTSVFILEQSKNMIILVINDIPVLVRTCRQQSSFSHTGRSAPPHL